MSVDTHELDEFIKRIQEFDTPEQNKFAKGLLTEVAGRIEEKAIKYVNSTPVNPKSKYKRTGKLNQSYMLSCENYGGLNCRVDLDNPIYYASYVEYGHRTANHKGWVEGKHMLANAKASIEPQMGEMAKKHFEKVVRKYIHD